jgi:signal transduction histidine kinase
MKEHTESRTNQKSRRKPSWLKILSRPLPSGNTQWRIDVVDRADASTCVFASRLHYAYPKSIEQEVSAERLRRFFVKSDDGYSRDELLSMRVFDIDPLVTPSTWPAVMDTLRRDKSLTVFGEHRRKDGTTFPVEVNVAFVSLERDYLVSVVRDVTERKQTEEALRQLSVRLLQSQDAERRRIARELHDSTGQQLAALAMNLSLIGKSEETLDARARKALAESLELVDQSAGDIRTLSYLLHPPMLDENGLAEAVRWFADGFTRRSGVHVQLEVPTELPRLPEEIEMALFRIVQEGLTNIHRHSGSSTATIRLVVDQSRVQLEMRDDGKGLPTPWRDGSAVPPGMGLTGMRERAKLLGGQMKMESNSHGTMVSVILPLAKVVS